MRKCLRGAAVAGVLAGGTWLIGCEGTRSPGDPTATNARPAHTIAMIAAAADVASVPWHCVATGAGWQAADCQAPRRVGLSSVAALTAPGSPTGLTASV